MPTKKPQFSGKLRQVKAKDLDEILRIEHECFDPALWWSRENYAPYFAKALSLSTIFSMAVLPANDNQPETVAGYSLTAIEADTTATIISIAVRKSFQGQGLGLHMVKHLAKGMKKKGATILDLQVEENNDTAIRLYKTFGFVATGSLPDYYAPGRHAIKMEMKF